MGPDDSRPSRWPTWVTRTVVGIVVATFLSDVGHEMATAVLPLYLAGVGLGPAAIGLMEGAADLAGSTAKLLAGLVGHRLVHKRRWGTLGYALTAVGISAMAGTRSLGTVVGLRAGAWFGRGFRSPLRDFMLADAVAPSHFGRAYGVERSADMAGALVGPLLAAAALALGASPKVVILLSVVPAGLAALSFFFGTEDHVDTASEGPKAPRPPLPPAFYAFLGGVFLFGLGDFSRTFLILVAAKSVGAYAVHLYAFHNLVSAVAAFFAGRAADARPRTQVLVVGYALGTVTSVLLALGTGEGGHGVPVLLAVIVLSGVALAVEETVEKAVVAEVLPRATRTLGLGILAGANALGDMASSLYVGFQMEAGHTRWAFGVPAALGAAGTLWMTVLALRPRPTTAG